MNDCPQEKGPDTPASGGGQKQRKHRTAWGDNWHIRHPKAKWSLLDRCEEPPPTPALKLFGRHSLSQQVGEAWKAKLKKCLPSDLCEEVERLLAQGNFVEANAIARFLDAQAKDFNDERDGEP